MKKNFKKERKSYERTLRKDIEKQFKYSKSV